MKICTAFMIVCLLGIPFGVKCIRSEEVWGYFVPKEQDEKRFEIYQSFCFTSGDYINTSIKVIVNEKDYDPASVFEEIRDFHSVLNGESDELEIRIYNSKRDFQNHNCAGRMVYYKE